ncbi:hypothetical protein V8C34DRAFT_321155 [Trichoderma compactum]
MLGESVGQAGDWVSAGGAGILHILRILSMETWPSVMDTTHYMATIHRLYMRISLMVADAVADAAHKLSDVAGVNAVSYITALSRYYPLSDRVLFSLVQIEKSACIGTKRLRFTVKNKPHDTIFENNTDEEHRGAYMFMASPIIMSFPFPIVEIPNLEGENLNGILLALRGDQKLNFSWKVDQCPTDIIESLSCRPLRRTVTLIDNNNSKKQKPEATKTSPRPNKDQPPKVNTKKKVNTKQTNQAELYDITKASDLKIAGSHMLGTVKKGNKSLIITCKNIGTERREPDWGPKQKVIVVKTKTSMIEIRPANNIR